MGAYRMSTRNLVIALLGSGTAGAGVFFLSQDLKRVRAQTASSLHEMAEWEKPAPVPRPSSDAFSSKLSKDVRTGWNSGVDYIHSKCKSASEKAYDAMPFHFKDLQSRVDEKMREIGAIVDTQSKETFKRIEQHADEVS